MAKHETQVVQVVPLTHKVFFYGTLREGMDRDIREWANGHAEHIGNGFVKGKLYLAFYPYVVLGGDGVVYGEVFKVSDAMMQELDNIEGVSYTRHTRTPHWYDRASTVVMLENNEPVTDVTVYAWKEAEPSSMQIANGDYVKFYNAYIGSVEGDEA